LAARPTPSRVWIRFEIDICFQQSNLFPNLTVLENYGLAPMLVHTKTRRDAEELTQYHRQKVKIPDQADQLPCQLSGSDYRGK
jgi:ABC-type polar amino acid transport system ATPase subunit